MNDVSPGWQRPRLDGQRIEHVGKEHVVADGRRQCRSGPGRRAGASRQPTAHARWPSERTLRIQDSLQAGRSRFYAEITRVRQMVDLSRGPLPLLFLFDELFNGTNSHDRCVGAESVVKGLIGHGAIGMVTTHDLALTQFAGGPDSRIANVHFADRLVDGKMIFDYRMRPGVVAAQ